MNATAQLHKLGQSLWLDNITREQYLAAADPEKTLFAFADHGKVSSSMAEDGGDSETILTAFADAGVDVLALATRLQQEGTKSFSKSWNDLMAVIANKSTILAKASADASRS